MYIHDKIIPVGTALFLEEHGALVVCDLHMGYEQELIRKGILVPKTQRHLIEDNFKKILRTIKPTRIIINGDLKHEFGRINKQEWNDITALLTYLKRHCKELIVLEGNHDPMLFPIAKKLDINLEKQYEFENILITHGDKEVSTDKEIIIMGHEHPSISLREGAKVERFKCYLKGNYQKSTLIAMPSFQPLLPGTDVLESNHLSPLLEDINKFQVYIVNEDTNETLFFGKVKDLRT